MKLENVQKPQEISGCIKLDAADKLSKHFSSVPDEHVHVIVFCRRKYVYTLLLSLLIAHTVTFMPPICILFMLANTLTLSLVSSILSAPITRNSSNGSNHLKFVPIFSKH